MANARPKWESLEGDQFLPRITRTPTVMKRSLGDRGYRPIGQDVNVRESGGPDHDAIVRYICGRHPDTIVATAMGATFFSCDESSWPNFATLVTTDEHDTSPVSNLARPGVFRLNISLSRERFAQLVGGLRDADFAALDTLMPHPVYAAQHWACILNPTTETFDRVIKPLLDEAHARVARAARAKQRVSD